MIRSFWNDSPVETTYLRHRSFPQKMIYEDLMNRSIQKRACLMSGQIQCLCLQVSRPWWAPRHARCSQHHTGHYRCSQQKRRHRFLVVDAGVSREWEREREREGAQHSLGVSFRYTSVKRGREGNTTDKEEEAGTTEYGRVFIPCHDLSNVLAFTKLNECWEVPLGGIIET